MIFISCEHDMNIFFSSYFVPQASDLSLEQINVITRTLQSGKKDRTRRIASLAKKVQELLSITPHDGNPENFLQTILRDYQYYALEEI